MTARFTYPDGYEETRDVTALARFGTTNSLTASVNENGKIQVHEPGISWLTASYAELSQRASLVVPFPSDVSEVDPTARGKAPSSADDQQHPLDRAWVAAAP